METVKYLVDKVFLPRRVGDPCRMPCRVRKEVWLELELEEEKRKHPPPVIFKKNKKVGGLLML